MVNRDSLAAFALAGLCVIAGTITTVLGHDAPSWLGDLAFVAVGGGAGAAVAGRKAVTS